MHRIALIMVSFILPVFINCHAAKLGSTPSMLVMEGEFGMQIDTENVQKDVPFNAFFDWIGNTSYSTEKKFRGSLALALISEEGEIKEIIHQENNLNLSPGWGFGQHQRFYNVRVSSDISDSDIIRFITLEKGEDAWLPVSSLQSIQTYCNVKSNKVMKSKITVNILGHNDIPFEGYCEGTYGESRQYDPIYSSGYNLAIKWPEDKPHHFVKVGPDLDRVQIDPDRILFQSVSKPEYTVTLMACSDEDLITEQRHFTVETPGSLSQQLTDNEDRLYINNISVSGHIDKNDIAFMRDEMPMLEHIDLSNADISGGILPDGAFNEKGIVSIILPESLNGLGANSLRNTKLFKLNIPKKVCYYGLNALNYSENLTVVVLNNPNVIPVSWCVLEGTNRSKGVLFVPKGTREAFATDEQWGKFSMIVEGDNTDDWVSANDGTYSYSGIYPNVTISEVTNPEYKMIVPETIEIRDRTFNVTGIGGRVFASYLINEIYIPKSVTSLGEYAVESTCSNLTKIEVDEDNPRYFSDGGVLYDRKTATMLTYPQAKADSEYTVPEGITDIGGWACYNKYLSKISLPSTLQSIGACAFCYSNLQYKNNPVIISKAQTPPFIYSSGFSAETYINAQVYVPANSLSSYKADPDWRIFNNIYPLSEESGIENIEYEDDSITISGHIVNINTNNPVEIYSIDGKLFHKGHAKSIELPTGIYLLRINGKVKKIRI